jgi:Phenazine biosynthesis-like protein
MCRRGEIGISIDLRALAGKMSEFVFRQVDVFTSRPLQGNALAVVLDADDLSESQMAAFAS